MNLIFDKELAIIREQIEGLAVAKEAQNQPSVEQVQLPAEQVNIIDEMNRKFSYELLLARSKLENDVQEQILHLKENMLGLLDKDTQDRLQAMQ